MLQSRFNHIMILSINKEKADLIFVPCWNHPIVSGYSLCSGPIDCTADRMFVQSPLATVVRSLMYIARTANKRTRKNNILSDIGRIRIIFIYAVFFVQIRKENR